MCRKKTVTLYNQDIELRRTDWQFRRSTGGQDDVDCNWNTVPPGHVIIFSEAGKYGKQDSQLRLEYISRTEGFGPERNSEDGTITRPFYLIDDDVVWSGTFVVKGLNP